MSNQDQEKNIAQGLSQLGETTTAAELLRQKGQTKKLRVISEKQLMDWILKLMQQHMAGKADAFSDLEKAELLKKTQDELNRRIKREQEAQAERDRLRKELDQAMSAVAAGSSAQSQADIEMALGALKEKLEQAEQINLDLQQDNYDLQDQLNEKMVLLSTTIAEKDKLRDTVRHQMMRMTTLCEGVLGIDNDYYGSRHQDENPVSDEATQDEQFYHDFDVGAKVITTLQADLERLRGIVKREEQAAVADLPALQQDAQPKALLEADLALLEQLKSGNLHAVDVAAPVAGLLEAMSGARLEAEAFETQVAEATGAGHSQVFTELPEEGGDPAEVLAGATAVTRELAASLARNRNRIAALKAIADESDEARNNTELELESVRAALDSVCTVLRQRAVDERIAAPDALADRDAAPEARAHAASEIVDQLQAASPVDAAAIEQLALTDRLVKASAPATEVKTTDRQLVAERLRKAGAELERYTLDLQRQLDEAAARERLLAKQVSELARRSGAEVTPAVRELERSIDAKADPQLLAMATARALDDVAGNGGRPAGVSAAFEEDRAVAAEIIKASQGDDGLAERAADLSLAADDADAKTQPQLGVQVREAVAALGARRRELAARVDELTAQLTAQLAAARSDQGRGSQESQRLQLDLDKAKADQQKHQNEVLRLRSGRDAANAAIDLIAAELKRRVPEAHPDLTDRASEPAARAAAANLALAKLAEHRAAEGAAIDAVAAIDRVLVRTGVPADRSAAIAPGDEALIAARLREATAALEQRIVSVGTDLDAARVRERELAKQVRELAAAQPAGSPAAVPRDDLARLERAIVDPASTDVTDAARKVMAVMKTNVGKVEAEARSAVTRSLAAELVKAGEGDAALAESSANLAVSLDGEDAGPELESDLRDAVLKLVARKRSLDAERARLLADLESVRAERIAALARAEQAEQGRRDEIARLGAELATVREDLEVAQSDANEFRARNEATGTQFSGEMLALRQELTALRSKHQEQSTAVAGLRQQVEASEARLKRQREELNKGLEERDNLIADKDRTIDQLSNQRIDAKAIQAKVQALSIELDAANSRIRELESRSGDQAGAVVRSGDLAELHKRTMGERDQLREAKRRMEGELADARANTDQLRTELAELRKEHQAEGESHAREVGEERQRNAVLKDALIKLQQEVAGIKARARKPGDAK